MEKEAKRPTDLIANGKMMTIVVPQQNNTIQIAHNGNQMYKIPISTFTAKFIPSKTE